MQNPTIFNALGATVFLFPGKKNKTDTFGHSQKSLFYGIFSLYFLYQSRYCFLCRQFHVDEHKRYNSVFAQLSDALNPLQIPRTALLSVHPCDFLEMSNKDNTWISCHNLANGSYQAGALSYMTDDVSMIFFTVDNDVANHYYRVPRRSRQMFFYQDNMLFQSRMYPSDLSELMEQYRILVQKAIATCLGQPNLWKLIRC